MGNSVEKILRLSLKKSGCVYSNQCSTPATRARRHPKLWNVSQQVSANESQGKRISVTNGPFHTAFRGKFKYVCMYYRITLVNVPFFIVAYHVIVDSIKLFIESKLFWRPSAVLESGLSFLLFFIMPVWHQMKTRNRKRRQCDWNLTADCSLRAEIAIINELSFPCFQRPGYCVGHLRYPAITQHLKKMATLPLCYQDISLHDDSDI